MKRRNGEGWLQLLLRLERGLCFTATNDDLVVLDGFGTATHTGQPHAPVSAAIIDSDTATGLTSGSDLSTPSHEATRWATAVCAEAVMLNGIHRCIFEIHTEHQITIGIVPAAWATQTVTWQGDKSASAGGWASDQEHSYLLTSDGRLWDGQHSDWAPWDREATQHKFAHATRVELELDLSTEGTLTARVDADGDDQHWHDRMAHGLKVHADRLGGFCWCAELAGKGDSVRVSWSPRCHS